MADNFATNIEMVLGFCRENEEQFGDYIDSVHEIESTETELILNMVEKEYATLQEKAPATIIRQ